MDKINVLDVKILPLFFVAILCNCFTVPAQNQRAIAGKPNIVIIMADQLRYDALGEFTPHINLLKAEGVSFSRAYCASPLCTPSRGSFFTGNYPNQTGSLINQWNPKDKDFNSVNAGMPNLYQVLENDWDSWHAGKQHFFTDEQIDQQPDSKTHWLSFERDYGPFLKANNVAQPGGKAYKASVPETQNGKTTRFTDYSIPTTGKYAPGVDYFFDGYILTSALKAMQERDVKKPFLLNAMFLAPHPPFQIPEPYFSKIKSVEMPENVGRWSKFQSPLQLYNATGILGNRYEREDWAKIWPVYMGLVSMLDNSVGAIVAELKKQGVYDQTLIVFTSDHGEMLGSHRLWQKMCMYEESSRVPLIIKFPKDYQPKIHESAELVSLIDVYPTLLEYLKIPLPGPVSGTSLLPVIEAKSVGSKPVFIQYDGNASRSNFQRCVIDGNYKLIVDMFQSERFIELYDIINDPQEGENLAFRPDQKEKVVELLSKLSQHMESTGDLLQLAPNQYDTFIADYSEYYKRSSKK